MIVPYGLVIFLENILKLYIFYHKNEYLQRKIRPNSILSKEPIAIVDHCDTKGCYKKEITYGCSYKLKP